MTDIVPPAARDLLVLEIVRTDEGFLALQPYWDSLLEQSQTRSPFLRWDWVQLWREMFHEEFDLAITVLRDANNAPVAIAPLAIGRDHCGVRKHLRHLCLIGSLGEVQGERLDFLVPRGRERELTPELTHAFAKLSKEWQAIRLNKIPLESANLPYILEALKQCSVGAGIVHSSVCSFARLPAEWGAYEAGHSSRWRRNMRKRWEGFSEEHRGTVAVPDTARIPEVMQEFAKLHAVHFPCGVSSFLRKRTWPFHRRLAEKWLAEGRAILPYLAVGGQMVAGVYGFVEGDEFYQYQIGWDQNFAKLSIGNLAIRLCMQLSIQRGLRVYDMLPGNYRYKEEWCPESRQVVDLEGYHPESLRANFFRGLRGVSRLVRKARAGGAAAHHTDADEGGEAWKC